MRDCKTYDRSISDTPIATAFANAKLTTRTAAAAAYIVCALLVALVLQSHVVMLVATSYCHYLIYIFTYYTRWPKGDRQKYNDFVVIVFSLKVLALAQLAILGFGILFNSPPYTFPKSFSLSSQLSIPLVVICVAVAAYGYYVSAMATKALGFEGTYFGIELGFVKADYKFVKVWPYNTYPHPMILGQVVAMVALHIGIFGVNYPWLIPIHCGLYLLHMVQESYDIWHGDPWYKKKNTTTRSAAPISVTEHTPV